MKRLFLLVLVTAWMVSGCRKESGQAGHQITLSTDSLQLLQTDLPDDTYNDLAFVDAVTGFAVASSGRIVRTKDGGRHWNNLPSNVSFFLNRVQFIGGRTGFVTGGDETGAYLLKTVDGGGSWTSQKLDVGEAGWPGGMWFINEQIGFITGNRYFKKTMDGGKTWSDVMGATAESLGDISFRTSKDGYVLCKGGRFYSTTDGGNTWVLHTAVVNSPLMKIAPAGSRSYANAGTDLIDLSSGTAVAAAQIPNGSRRLLFLNDVNSVAIGQHFENGFFPYGDITVTNASWKSKQTKTFSPASGAMDFTAIAKRTDGKVLIIGRALLSTPVIELSY